MLMLVIVIILCFYIYPESTNSSDCRFKNNNMRHILYDRDTSLTCVFFSCASWSISWAVGFKSDLVWHQEFKMERYIWSISCFWLVLREMLLISKKNLVFILMSSPLRLFCVWWPYIHVPWILLSMLLLLIWFWYHYFSSYKTYWSR